MTHEQKKHTDRLQSIRENINPRGDITRIAKKLEVSRVWVSYVLHGHGISERVLLAAEELIHSRQN